MGDGQDDPGEAIEGEIIPAPGQKRHWNSGGNRHNAHVDEDTVKGVIADRVSGMTLRGVAAKWGVSPETVRRWAGEDLANRQRVEVPALRAEAAQQLDAARQQSWAMFQAAKGRGLLKTMENALIRVESTTMAKAKLEGAIAPVRVDMQVTEVTEAELELQEFLNEAKAKTAAAEQAVIDAASADPDL